MKYHLFWVMLICGICSTLAIQAQLTPFEKSGGKETATYEECIDFYRQLDKQSKLLYMKAAGPSDADLPLHIVLLSSDSNFDPDAWRKQNKVIIFINNGIHPGEPDGIDASMLLARDIVAGKLRLPENVSIAILPVYNIGGCLNRNSTSRVNQNGPVSYGFRGNSQYLDLNRDFIKCDSREALSYSKIFHWLDPDIFIDTHVSDGADFQHVMTLITTQYNKLGVEQGAYLRDSLEPLLYSGMKQGGYPMIPYVLFENFDPQKGLNMFLDMPRYSSGYAAFFQCFSFMSEAHMLKPFGQRVDATYKILSTLISIAGTSHTSIKLQRKKARSALMQQKEFPLAWISSPDTANRIFFPFNGYDIDSITSEVTRQPRIRYNHDKPFTRDVAFHHRYDPSSIVTKPAAYIIPKGWHAVIDRLQANDVKMERLRVDTQLMVSVYRIDSFKTFREPFEKHYKHYQVRVYAEKAFVQFRRGDYWIPTDQKAVRYLVEVLEPSSEDGFFAWNFFDAVLQQKEGYSDYRFEDVAAELLKQDTVLAFDVAELLKKDPMMNHRSGRILDLVYKRSRYYEPGHLLYPVYRVEMIHREE